MCGYAQNGSGHKRFTALAAIGAAAAAALCALTVSPPTGALPTYVAIAYSPSDGIYGWANNASTRGDAENAAMSYCVQYGGADCQVAA
ncbi:MAG: DUF4189 domain-containing protein [Candidatus Sericytochromatia bacterium]